MADVMIVIIMDLIEAIFYGSDSTNAIIEAFLLNTLGGGFFRNTLAIIIAFFSGAG